MITLLEKSALGLLVFMLLVFGIMIRNRMGVSKLKISYKLVVEKDGQVTEEAFENFEAMLERVKVLEEEATKPAEPATLAEGTPATPAAEAGAEAGAAPVDPTPPAGDVPPAV